jgi:hypothetical protein
MNNLRGTEVARYIVGSHAPMGEVFDVLDKLPLSEGAHAVFGRLRVTCTDDGHDMRFDIEDERH